MARWSKLFAVSVSFLTYQGGKIVRCYALNELILKPICCCDYDIDIDTSMTSVEDAVKLVEEKIG